MLIHKLQKNMIFLKTLYNQSLDWWIKHKSMCYSSVWLTHARLPHHIFFIFFIFTYCRLANPLSVSVVKITISGTSFLGNVLKVFFFFFFWWFSICHLWVVSSMAKIIDGKILGNFNKGKKSGKPRCDAINTKAHGTRKNMLETQRRAFELDEEKW